MSDEELPGMWEAADFSGGLDEVRPKAEIAKWGDSQQYYSEPMPEAAKKGPVVTLINAMPDPLGSLAAICGIYSGKVVRDLSEVSDKERKAKFQDMMETVLNGALEVAQFHFLIEGVSRSFTHQAVRMRGAFYAQESLRFAVKEMWSDEVQLPPSLQGGLPPDDPRIIAWNQALSTVEESYKKLVNSGVPAEEARDLLPHAVTTRYHWVVDLRGLLQEAGKRTCTQAQFAWRIVFAQVAKALREYGERDIIVATGYGDLDRGTPTDGWQFKLIADQLRPNCYQTGSCGFMAKFDRGCKIRERVEAFGSVGVPSTEWGKNYDPENAYADGGPREGQIGGPDFIKAIQPWEWAGDPSAARK